MNPPLPDATFGNLWTLANTTITPSETNPSPDDDDDLVFQLRTSIRGINAEYVEALQNEKGQSEHLRKWHERFSTKEAEFLEFTSWCRFPIYEVDFGWGRPIWACRTSYPYKNLIILMSTKCGDGIEAWINMGEDDIYDHGRLSQLLKQSFSKGLTPFFPCWTDQRKRFLDCSDRRAVGFKPRSWLPQSVVEKPLMEELGKGEKAWRFFVSHKIGDALLWSTFETWAVTRGEGSRGISPPQFWVGVVFFPPTTEDPTGSGFSSTLAWGRGKRSSPGAWVRQTKPGGFEENCGGRIASRKNPHGSEKKTFRATQNVNLRARMNPPLPDATFGNLWSLANTIETPSETNDDLVFQLRTSIREINAEYVEALQNGKGHSEHLHKWHERFSGEGEAEFLEFTSVCRFPIYEVDFGWGKPVWACITTFPYKNLVILMSTKCGDGIEAWINTGEEDDIYMGARSLTPTPKL
nr:vinorine synthase-like [Ipomoea batatas]